MKYKNAMKRKLFERVDEIDDEIKEHETEIEELKKIRQDFILEVI